MIKKLVCLVALFLLLFAGRAPAEDAEREPAAILEVGPAVETAITSGGSSYGPSVAVKTTPLEHWLEIEGGVARMFARDHSDWDVDLLSKKPFVLSPTTEFMIGAGPSWTHTLAQGRTEDSFGAEGSVGFHVLALEGKKGRLVYRAELRIRL